LARNLKAVIDTNLFINGIQIVDAATFIEKVSNRVKA